MNDIRQFVKERDLLVVLVALLLNEKSRFSVKTAADDMWSVIQIEAPIGRLVFAVDPTLSVDIERVSILDLGEVQSIESRVLDLKLLTEWLEMRGYESVAERQTQQT